MANYKRLFAEAVADTIKDHGVDNNLVRPGFWMVRFAKNASFVPAMIAWCQHEPDNEENILDSGPYLIGAIAGKDADPIDVYAAHEKREIDAAEYRYQIADLTWARAHAPAEQKGNPRRPIDLTTLPPVEP